MSRRSSIFDRLALKERVAINQQMKSLGALSNEFRQLDEMRQKLDEMARDQAPSDGVQNAGSLRAAAQLNFQIQFVLCVGISLKVLPWQVRPPFPSG